MRFKLHIRQSDFLCLTEFIEILTKENCQKAYPGEKNQRWKVNSRFWFFVIAKMNIGYYFRDFVGSTKIFVVDFFEVFLKYFYKTFFPFLKQTKCRRLQKSFSGSFR